LKEKDIGELHNKWKSEWKVIIGVIATAVGISIALALGLLAVFGPK